MIHTYQKFCRWSRRSPQLCSVILWGNCNHHFLATDITLTFLRRWTFCNNNVLYVTKSLKSRERRVVATRRWLKIVEERHLGNLQPWLNFQLIQLWQLASRENSPWARLLVFLVTKGSQYLRKTSVCAEIIYVMLLEFFKRKTSFCQWQKPERVLVDKTLMVSIAPKDYIAASSANLPDQLQSIW